MSARRRTRRDQRRRRLGQNFLNARVARGLVAGADFRPGEHVVEIGAGRGAFTTELARIGVRLYAIEPDPEWAAELRLRLGGARHVEVVEGDVLSAPLPSRPFRVIGSLPFGSTTAILRRLLAEPGNALQRADMLVQWEVAQKRAAMPPTTLLSTTWAPWWRFRLGQRIPATAFRPVPRVDGGMLVIARRDPPTLPVGMAPAYADFVTKHWPFAHSGRAETARSHTTF